MSGKYDSWKLTDLKEELRRRKARCTGKKKDLIDRLVHYDRNQNFGNEQTQRKDWNMTLPDSKVFKDVNTDSSIPCMTKENVDNYLQQFEKSSYLTAQKLYDDRYLQYIRSVIWKGLTYVKAGVNASMRKQLTYHVDISIDNHGIVQEAQCECAVGMGPDCHCKHVSVVLCAITDFSSSKMMKVQLTCTEKLQSFHQAPKHHGSPVKAENLKMTEDDSKNFTYDPRPENLRNHPGYPDYFRNLCINFAKRSNMPINQLHAPADTKAVFKDHDYLEKSHESTFLEKENITSISKEEILKIELSTRGQNTCQTWKNERCKRITASNFKRVCTAGERTDKDKLARSLVVHKTFKSKYTNHGIKYEKTAKDKFSSTTGLCIRECGIFVSEETPYMSATPDGLIEGNDDELLEIKCPFTARNKLINEKTVPYLKLDSKGDLHLDTKHDYYYQVQGQLYCADKQRCHFVIFTRKDLFVEMIPRNDQFISEMVIKISSFFNDHFCSSVIERLLYRDFNRFSFV